MKSNCCNAPTNPRYTCTECGKMTKIVGQSLSEKEAIEFLKSVWLPRNHKLYQSHRNILEGKAGGVTIAKVLQSVGYGTGEQITEVRYPVSGTPNSFYVVEHEGLYFTGIKTDGKPGWAKAISRAQHYETPTKPEGIKGSPKEIYTVP